MDWSGLQSERVFFWFTELCAIPHGSGNTKAISDFCVEFAKKKGLEYKQDKWNNVVIIKNASPGYETAPAMMLQGHLDMVCEKEPGSNFDFTKDSLNLCRKGDFLFAQGTTLGADDGIAVAIMLAVLESESISHPRLETIFTTDEETGMTGAEHIDLSWLQGKKMINIDSEQEGIFTVGCAGGGHVNWTLPIERSLAQGIQVTLTISGLTGGHSGMEIGKEGANAVVLLGKLLFELQKNIEFSIFSVFGGTQSNAIPVAAQAELLIKKQEGSLAKQTVLQLEREWRRSFDETDPSLCVLFSVGEEQKKLCFTNHCKARLIFLLYHYPYGVVSRDVAFHNMVRTSLNLGKLECSEQEIRGVFCVRSNIEAEKQDLINRLISLTEEMGGHVEQEGDYPAWEARHASSLQEMMAKIYRKQAGKDPVIEIIHAGLECGLFARKISELDCVSIGPDILEIHTVRERLCISSVERLWRFLLEVLKRSNNE